MEFIPDNANTLPAFSWVEINCVNVFGQESTNRSSRKLTRVFILQSQSESQQKLVMGSHIEKYGTDPDSIPYTVNMCLYITVCVRFNSSCLYLTVWTEGNIERNAHPPPMAPSLEQLHILISLSLSLACSLPLSLIRSLAPPPLLLPSPHVLWNINLTVQYNSWEYSCSKQGVFFTI